MVVTSRYHCSIIAGHHHRYWWWIDLSAIYLYTILMEPKLIDRLKVLETCVVIITALTIFYLWKGTLLSLYISILLSIITIFFKRMARWITVLWFSLATLLGRLMSFLLLVLVFYLILSPIALLYRAIKKDTFGLRKPENGNWYTRNKSYTINNLENPW